MSPLCGSSVVRVGSLVFLWWGFKWEHVELTLTSSVCLVTICLLALFTCGRVTPPGLVQGPHEEQPGNSITVKENERVISNRLYLSEGRSHRDATNGSWRRSLCSTNRDGLSHMAIPRLICTQECWHWLGFPIKRNSFEVRAAPPPRYDPQSNNQASTYVWRHAENSLFNRYRRQVLGGWNIKWL